MKLSVMDMGLMSEWAFSSDWGKKLMLVPQTAWGFRASQHAAIPWWEQGCEFSHLLSTRGSFCASAGEEPRQTHAWGHHPGGGGESGHQCPGSLATPLRALWLGSLQSPPPLPALYCVSSAGTRSGETIFPDRTLRFASLSGDYIAPKGPLQCKRCQCFGHTQWYCGYATRGVACGEAHLSGECSTSQQQLKCCNCGGNHTANYQCSVKWKEAKGALAK